MGDWNWSLVGGGAGGNQIPFNYQGSEVPAAPPAGWSAAEWDAYNNADAYFYHSSTTGGTDVNPKHSHVDPQSFDAWYHQSRGQQWLSDPNNQAGGGAGAGGPAQPPGQDQLMAFAQKMMAPPDPNDPTYKSIVASAGQSGANAAANQGIGGGLSVANTQASVAGAAAGYGMQRAQLGEQAMASATQLGQNATAQQYAMYLNGLAQKQAAFGSALGVAGAVLGGAYGGAAGASIGGQAGQGLGMGLSSMTAPPYTGPGAYNPGGGGGGGFQPGR